MSSDNIAWCVVVAIICGSVVLITIIINVFNTIYDHSVNEKIKNIKIDIDWLTKQYRIHSDSIRNHSVRISKLESVDRQVCDDNN